MHVPAHLQFFGGVLCPALLEAVEALEVTGVSWLKRKRGDGSSAGSTRPVALKSRFFSGGCRCGVFKPFVRRGFACEVGVLRYLRRLCATSELIGFWRGSATAAFLIFHKAVAAGKAGLTPWLKGELGDRSAATAAFPISLIHMNEFSN